MSIATRRVIRNRFAADVAKLDLRDENAQMLKQLENGDHLKQSPAEKMVAGIDMRDPAITDSARELYKQQTPTEDNGHLYGILKQVQSGIADVFDRLATEQAVEYMRTGNETDKNDSVRDRKIANFFRPKPYYAPLGQSNWGRSFASGFRNLPNSATKAAPSIATGLLAGAATGGASIAIRAAGALGSALLSGYEESRGEGAETAIQALLNGKTREQALDAEQKNFLVNMLYTVGPEAVSNYLGTKAIGAFMKPTVTKELTKQMGKAAAEEVIKKQAGERGKAIIAGNIKRALQGKLGKVGGAGAWLAGKTLVDTVVDTAQEPVQNMSTRYFSGDPRAQGKFFNVVPEEDIEAARGGFAGALIGNAVFGGAGKGVQMASKYSVPYRSVNEKGQKNLYQESAFYNSVADKPEVVNKEQRPTQLYDNSVRRLERVNKNIEQINAKGQPEKYAKKLAQLQAEQKSLNDFVTSIDEADRKIDARVGANVEGNVAQQATTTAQGTPEATAAPTSMQSEQAKAAPAAEEPTVETLTNSLNTINQRLDELKKGGSTNKYADFTADNYKEYDAKRRKLITAVNSLAKSDEATVRAQIPALSDELTSMENDLAAPGTEPKNVRYRIEPNSDPDLQRIWTAQDKARNILDQDYVGEAEATETEGLLDELNAQEDRRLGYINRYNEDETLLNREKAQRQYYDPVRSRETRLPKKAVTQSYPVFKQGQPIYFKNPKNPTEVVKANNPEDSALLLQTKHIPITKEEYEKGSRRSYTTTNWYQRAKGNSARVKAFEEAGRPRFFANKEGKRIKAKDVNNAFEMFSNKAQYTPISEEQFNKVNLVAPSSADLQWLAEYRAKHPKEQREGTIGSEAGPIERVASEPENLVYFDTNKKGERAVRFDTVDEAQRIAEARKAGWREINKQEYDSLYKEDAKNYHYQVERGEEAGTSRPTRGKYLPGLWDSAMSEYLEADSQDERHNTREEVRDALGNVHYIDVQKNKKLDTNAWINALRERLDQTNNYKEKQEINKYLAGIRTKEEIAADEEYGKAIGAEKHKRYQAWRPKNAPKLPSDMLSIRKPTRKDRTSKHIERMNDVKSDLAAEIAEKENRLREEEKLSDGVGKGLHKGRANLLRDEIKFLKDVSRSIDKEGEKYTPEGRLNKKVETLRKAVNQGLGTDANGNPYYLSSKEIAKAKNELAKAEKELYNLQQKKEGPELKERAHESRSAEEKKKNDRIVELERQIDELRREKENGKDESLSLRQERAGLRNERAAAIERGNKTLAKDSLRRIRKINTKLKNEDYEKRELTTHEKAETLREIDRLQKELDSLREKTQGVVFTSEQREKLNKAVEKGLSASKTETKVSEPSEKQFSVRDMEEIFDNGRYRVPTQDNVRPEDIGEAETTEADKSKYYTDSYGVLHTKELSKEAEAMTEQVVTEERESLLEEKADLEAAANIIPNTEANSDKIALLLKEIEDVDDRLKDLNGKVTQGELKHLMTEKRAQLEKQLQSATKKADRARIENELAACSEYLNTIVSRNTSEDIGDYEKERTDHFTPMRRDENGELVSKDALTKEQEEIKSKIEASDKYRKNLVAPKDMPNYTTVAEYVRNGKYTNIVGYLRQWLGATKETVLALQDHISRLSAQRKDAYKKGNSELVEKIDKAIKKDREQIEKANSFFKPVTDLLNTFPSQRERVKQSNKLIAISHIVRALSSLNRDQISFLRNSLVSKNSVLYKNVLSKDEFFTDDFDNPLKTKDFTSKAVRNDFTQIAGPREWYAAPDNLFASFYRERMSDKFWKSLYGFDSDERRGQILRRAESELRDAIKQMQNVSAKDYRDALKGENLASLSEAEAALNNEETGLFDGAVAIKKDGTVQTREGKREMTPEERKKHASQQTDKQRAERTAELSSFSELAGKALTAHFGQFKSERGNDRIDRRNKDRQKLSFARKITGIIDSIGDWIGTGRSQVMYERLIKGEELTDETNGGFPVPEINGERITEKEWALVMQMEDKFKRDLAPALEKGRERIKELRAEMSRKTTSVDKKKALSAKIDDINKRAKDFINRSLVPMIQKAEEEAQSEGALNLVDNKSAKNVAEEMERLAKQSGYGSAAVNYSSKLGFAADKALRASGILAPVGINREKLELKRVITDENGKTIQVPRKIENMYNQLTESKSPAAREAAAKQILNFVKNATHFEGTFGDFVKSFTETSDTKYRVDKNGNEVQSGTAENINEASIKKMFKGAKVEVEKQSDGSYLVSFLNGTKFKITQNGNIVVDYDVIARTWGKDVAESVKRGESVVVGSADFDGNGVPIINLAKGMTDVTTFGHEIFHIAAHSMLSPKELGVLMKHFARDEFAKKHFKRAEEIVADVYGEYLNKSFNRKDTLARNIFRNLYNKCLGIASYFSETAKANYLFSKMESGEIFNRAKGSERLEKTHGVKYDGKVANEYIPPEKDGIGGINYSGNKNDTIKDTLLSKGKIFSGSTVKKIWKEFQKHFVSQDIAVKKYLGDEVAKMFQDMRYLKDDAFVFAKNELIAGLEKAGAFAPENGTKEQVIAARRIQEATDAYSLYKRVAEVIKNREHLKSEIASCEEQIEKSKQILASASAKGKMETAARNSIKYNEGKIKKMKMSSSLNFTLGKYEKDAKYYSDAADKIAQQVPEVVQAQRVLVNFDHKLLEMLKDAGCIKKSSYDNLIKKGQDYIFLGRDIDPSSTDENFLNDLDNIFDPVDVPIRDFTGGEIDGDALFKGAVVQSIILANKVHSAVKTQLCHNEIMKQVDKCTDTRKKPTEQQLHGIIGYTRYFDEAANKWVDVPMPKGCQEWTPLYNGERQKMYICPELKAALDITKKPSTLGFFRKALKAINNITVVGATKNLGFSTNNTIQDSLVAGATTKGFIPIIDSVRNVAHAFLNDEVAQDFEKHGGQGANWRGEQSILKLLGRNYLGNKPTQGKLSKAWDMLDRIVDASEECTRIGVYQAQIKNLTKEYEKEHGSKPTGVDLENIKKDAGRFAMDSLIFARGGDWAVALGKGIPFFNPAIQGSYGFLKKLAPNGKIDKSVLVRSVFVYSLSAILLNVLNNLTPEQRKRMDKLEPWQRYGYYNFNFFGDHHMVRISRSHFPAVLFGVIPEMIYDRLRGKKDFNFTKTLFGELFESLTPNVVPGFIRAMIENTTGYSLRYGRVMRRLKDAKLPKHLRYSPYTKDTFIVMANLLHKLDNAIGAHDIVNVSPDDLQNLYDQTTGTLGQDFTNWFTDPLARVVTGRTKEKRAFYTNIPSLNRFMWPVDEQKGVVNNFRNQVEELQQKLGAMEHYAKDGGVKAIPTEYNKYLNVAGSIKKVGKYVNEINKCNRNINDVRESKKLTPEKKRYLIDKQRAVIEKISESGLKYIDAIEKHKKK